MDQTPGCIMTRRTVAASRKALQIRVVRRRQRAGRQAVAVRAVGKMRRRRCAEQCILMTVGTTRRSRSRHQAAVIRCRRMDRVPGGTVTRRTVAAGGKALQIRVVRRGQLTVGRVMAV